jgi:Nicotinic acid mononucleotide adenylyltransferase
MGEDSARSFHKWYGYEQIMAHHRLFVAQRAEKYTSPYHIDVQVYIEVIDHPND